MIFEYISNNNFMSIFEKYFVQHDFNNDINSKNGIIYNLYFIQIQIACFVFICR